MIDLRELYSELLQEHAKSPRNFGSLDNPSRQVKGYNPVCGDKIELFLNLDNDTIEDVRFNGSGCAICMASSSLMTEQIKGKTETEAKQIFDLFHDLLLGKVEFAQVLDSLGDLAALAGVRQFPIRVKCATLPWHTMKRAFETPAEDGEKPVSTE